MYKCYRQASWPNAKETESSKGLFPGKAPQRQYSLPTCRYQYATNISNELRHVFPIVIK